MRKVLENKYEKLFETYHFERPIEAKNINSIIRESLQSFMKECTKPAIYCNGGHTKMLMADFMYELKSVKYIVDNYTNSSNDGGFILIKDEELESNEIDAVIISSYKFKDDIVNGLKKKHPQIKYLNIYDKFAESGIDLQSDYYYHNHPYHHYHTINTIQRKIDYLTQTGELEKAYYQLITNYIHIKDFRTAISWTRKLIAISNTKKNRQLINDLEDIYNAEKKATTAIADKNVLMLCMDGLRREDLSEQYMPKLTKEFENNAFVFSNAYSFSTSTYESLIPVYSENSDLRTKYYNCNLVSGDKCRFINEAREQQRNIYFYTDMDRYVDGKDIRYSGTFQTATEKIWNFVLDAVEEKNGLFYIHILYESHFSFSNPYTQDKLISEGTALLFDFLPQKGGKLRTNYEQQHLDAVHYLDDVLATILNRLNCRMLVYADHGNLILEQSCNIEDIHETKFTCAEEWIRIPYIIKSPEMGSGISQQMVSLMSLNEVVVSLLKQNTYVAQKNDFIKVARSELYNPDFRYLYKKNGKEQCLSAFEAYIFEEGYKLVVFADGDTELFKTVDDEKCNDGKTTKRLFNRIKACLTVCEAENVRFS